MRKENKERRETRRSEISVERRRLKVDEYGTKQNTEREVGGDGWMAERNVYVGP